MDTTIAKPQVLNLEEDILLHIFHINTLMPETEYYDSTGSVGYFNRPLNVARWSSQVCRSWRQLILGSPSIWASMIDLESIGSNEWAEEVTRRARPVYLSIYGSIGHSSQSCSFFTTLLANHWDRIRRLYVSVSREGHSIDQSAWENIRNRPAPNMESFVLRLDLSLLAELSAPWEGPLFADSAPSLRRFHDCGSLFSASLNPEFTWINKLSSVTLSKPLTTTDVLNILSKTVQLESVIIQPTTFDPPSMKWTKHIDLPRLIRIHIEGATVGESLVYLGNIVPKSGCALLLSTRDEQEQISAEKLVVLAKLIAPYSESYFNLHKPTKMYVQDTRYGSFSLHCDKSTNMVYFGHPELKFNVLQPYDWLWEPLTTSFDPVFSALSSISLHHITQLALYIIEDDAWILTGKPGFIDFIWSFSSVEDLGIPNETLRIINHILPDYPQAFPSLKRVGLNVNSDDIPALTQDISQFLSLRKAAGISVSTLEIDNFLSVKDEGDWRFFDEYDGMLFLWREFLGGQVEYKCGSGEM